MQTAFGIVSFIALSYVVPMHMHLVQPTQLVPTVVDRAVPFLEWTIWIYISYFAILFVPFIVCRDESRVLHVLYALALNSVIAGAIFLTMPTQVSVQHPSGGGLTGLLWQALLAIDRPVNCVPSLHVANASVCAFALQREGNGWRYGGLVWLTLIVLSTLTTKQHFFVDVAAGVLLAVSSFWWLVQPSDR